VQYNGNVYLTSGNLIFPLLSLGLFCSFTYFWTAWLSIKLGNQLRVIASTRVSVKTALRFRKLSFANLGLSCLLLMTSSYLISLTSYWYHYKDHQLQRSESLAGLASAGKAAVIIHALHVGVAILELLINAVGLAKIPVPPLKIALTYQPHGFTTPSLRRTTETLLYQCSRQSPAIVKTVSGSVQTLQTSPYVGSTTSITSNF
jgi:hypothetical protein